MFYFTVRCRGEGMAARFPAVIDTFSSPEGRKGNLNALTEGEKDNNREVREVKYVNIFLAAGLDLIKTGELLWKSMFLLADESAEHVFGRKTF